MAKGGLFNTGGVRFIDMPAGTDVSPAADRVTDVRRIAGQLMSSTDGGVWTALGGGGATGWAGTKFSRAQAVSTTLDGYYYTDNLLTTEWAAGAFNASGTAKWNDSTNTTYDPSCVTLDATGG